MRSLAGSWQSVLVRFVHVPDTAFRRDVLGLEVGPKPDSAKRRLDDVADRWSEWGADNHRVVDWLNGLVWMLCLERRADYVDHQLSFQTLTQTRELLVSLPTVLVRGLGQPCQATGSAPRRPEAPEDQAGPSLPAGWRHSW